MRGDSAYGNSAVVAACLKAKVRVLGGADQEPGRRPGDRAPSPTTPGRRCTTPARSLDPDTGELISDAEVAETTYTAFAATKQPVTARLIVRRVRDQAKLEELFPVWRYHPFFTNSTEPTVDADLTHRRHAVIETVFADLIDGPLAHLPSGRFAANSAWAVCAMITHNLLRAAGTLDQPASMPWPAAPPCAASSSTSPPGSPDRNADPCCTCPRTGPGPTGGWRSGTACSDTRPGHQHRLTHPPAAQARPENPPWKSWADQPINHAPRAPEPSQHPVTAESGPTRHWLHGSRLSGRRQKFVGGHAALGVADRSWSSMRARRSLRSVAVNFQSMGLAALL